MNIFTFSHLKNLSAEFNELPIQKYQEFHCVYMKKLFKVLRFIGVVMYRKLNGIIVVLVSFAITGLFTI